MSNEIPMPNYDSDAYEMAMNYRMVAGKLFNAMMELLAINGCKCVFAPEIQEWHEGCAGITNMAERVRYASENPFPVLDNPVIEVCNYCNAMNEYQELVGDDAIALERNSFIKNNDLMPKALKEILDEELGHLTGDQLMDAFLLGSDNDEIISAVERAQKRASEYLKTYDNEDE
jgi:hypothetical protein